MRVLLMILIIAVAIFVATFAADAQQPQCGPLDQMRKELAEKYGEHPAWVGADAQGPVILFQNPNKGTWSFVAMRRGLACFLGAGEQGQLVDLPKKGDPA